MNCRLCNVPANQHGDDLDHDYVAPPPPRQAGHHNRSDAMMLRLLNRLGEKGIFDTRDLAYVMGVIDDARPDERSSAPGDS